MHSYKPGILAMKHLASHIVEITSEIMSETHKLHTEGSPQHQCATSTWQHHLSGNEVMMHESLMLWVVLASCQGTDGFKPVVLCSIPRKGQINIFTHTVPMLPA